MLMTPPLRKLALTAHIVFSIGWFGAASAVLVLAVAGLTSANASVVSGAYVGTELIWRFAILPFSIAALLTGLIQAIGTPWGLFRHYWVLTKFLITLGAVLLLFLHTHSLLPALSSTEGAASQIAHNHAGMPPRAHLIVAASGTLLLLLATAALSVYKPWSKTPYGRRKAAAQINNREP
jgi:hypothetical protein